MAFLTGGANTLDDSYSISNSLRFNDDDSPNVSNNPNAGSGSDGSRTQFSISMWVKRSRVSGTQQFLTSAVATNTFYGTIKFNGDNKIQVNLINSGSDQDEIVTDAVYRDVGAWYHLFFVFDKTQASLSKGIKLYVNGVLQTWGTTTYAQNEGYHFFRPGKTHYIGNYNGQEGYFDGYMAEIHFIDGSLKAHTDFGETNDNGVWIPKEYTGSHGTYGFFLEFKQTGTSENSSGIGADTSGNDEHFAVANLASTDVTTDTPTNNFCTLNSVANSSMTTLAEGNLKGTGNSSSNNGNSDSTFAVANGKWYVEMKCTTRNTGSSAYYPTIGVAKPENLGRLLNGGSGQAGNIADSAGYEADGNKRVGGTTSSHGSSLSDGNIVQVALDMDNGAVYFGVNGTWQNSSDPESGSSKTNAAHTWTADGRNYMFGLASYNSSVAEMNFGNAPFSISSGHADGNGYGNFEHEPPANYYALCTKNLAEYG